MTGRWTRTLLATLTIGLVCGVANHGLRGPEQPGIAPEPLTVDAGAVGYGGVAASAADFGCRPWEYGSPNLFYNFYVPTTAAAPWPPCTSLLAPSRRWWGTPTTPTSR